MQSNVISGEQGLRGQNNAATQFQTQELFWRRAVSEGVPAPGKTTARILVSCLRGTNPSDLLHLRREADSKARQTRAKVKIKLREVFNSRWTELQFPVDSPYEEGLSAKVSNYPGSSTQAAGFKFLRVSHPGDSSDLGTSCR